MCKTRSHTNGGHIAASGETVSASNSHVPAASAEDDGWQEFRDQCRRQMRRSLDQRIRYGFCRMYKPILDDAPWRAFDTIAEYRAWCEANLPPYLGFKRAAK